MKVEKVVDGFSPVLPRTPLTTFHAKPAGIYSHLGSCHPGATSSYQIFITLACHPAACSVPGGRLVGAARWKNTLQGAGRLFILLIAQHTAVCLAAASMTLGRLCAGDHPQLDPQQLPFSARPPAGTCQTRPLSCHIPPGRLAACGRCPARENIEEYVEFITRFPPKL